MKKESLKFHLAMLCFVLTMNFQVHGQIITTIVGGGTSGLGDGGPATAASIGLGASIALDASGNIYIADGNNQRVRKVDAATGIITTVAGTGIAGFSGDGGYAIDAQLNVPGVVALDTSGNLYIGDAYNYRIRKVNAITGIISTFAGTGIHEFSGDGGPASAARIFAGDFVFDIYNNFIMVDETLDTCRIRKVDGTGIITTIAGTGLWGCSGDGGPATAATFHVNWGICSDRSGNIFLTDGSAAIRKINAVTGIVTRVAGMEDSISTPYSGDGYPATDSHIDPIGLAVDYIGNLYIADAYNNRIEMVDTMGIIHTIAGTGVRGFSGDGGLAAGAKMYDPENVLLDNCGNLYISDRSNYRVRKVTMPPSLVISLTGLLSAAIGDTVTVSASVHNAGYHYTITWLNNGVPFATTTTPSVSYIKTHATDSITAVVYGCSDSAVSAVHVVTDSRVGVGQVAAGGSVSLYPNPGHSEFCISSPERVVSVVVTNLTGEVVYTGASALVNVKPWPPGMYFVKLNGLSVLKFLKE